jgi:hypothetical protein
MADFSRATNVSTVILGATFVVCIALLKDVVVG